MYIFLKSLKSSRTSRIKLRLVKNVISSKIIIICRYEHTKKRGENDVSIYYSSVAWEITSDCPTSVIL